MCMLEFGKMKRQALFTTTTVADKMRLAIKLLSLNVSPVADWNSCRNPLTRLVSKHTENVCLSLCISLLKWFIIK